MWLFCVCYVLECVHVLPACSPVKGFLFRHCYQIVYDIGSFFFPVENIFANRYQFWLYFNSITFTIFISACILYTVSLSIYAHYAHRLFVIGIVVCITTVWLHVIIQATGWFSIWIDELKTRWNEMFSCLSFVPYSNSILLTHFLSLPIFSRSLSLHPAVIYSQSVSKCLDIWFVRVFYSILRMKMRAMAAKREKRTKNCRL